VSRIYHLDKCLKIYYSINTSIDTDTVSKVSKVTKVTKVSKVTIVTKVTKVTKIEVFHLSNQKIQKKYY